jgi:hypothetical protein
MKRIGSIAMALCLLAACDEGGTTTTPTAAPTTKTTTATTAPKGPTTAAATDDMDKADIPVAEDFEEEAEKAINEDNLDDEVAKLEKEITEDK